MQWHACDDDLSRVLQPFLVSCAAAQHMTRRLHLCCRCMHEKESSSQHMITYPGLTSCLHAETCSRCLGVPQIDLLHAVACVPALLLPDVGDVLLGNVCQYFPGLHSLPESCIARRCACSRHSPCKAQACSEGALGFAHGMLLNSLIQVRVVSPKPGRLIGKLKRCSSSTSNATWQRSRSSGVKRSSSMPSTSSRMTCMLLNCRS